MKTYNILDARGNVMCSSLDSQKIDFLIELLQKEVCKYSQRGIKFDSIVTRQKD